MPRPHSLSIAVDCAHRPCTRTTKDPSGYCHDHDRMNVLHTGAHAKLPITKLSYDTSAIEAGAAALKAAPSAELSDGKVVLHEVFTGDEVYTGTLKLTFEEGQTMTKGSATYTRTHKDLVITYEAQHAGAVHQIAISMLRARWNEVALRSGALDRAEVYDDHAEILAALDISAPSGEHLSFATSPDDSEIVVVRFRPHDDPDVVDRYLFSAQWVADTTLHQRAHVSAGSRRISSVHDPVEQDIPAHLHRGRQQTLRQVRTYLEKIYRYRIDVEEQIALPVGWNIAD